MHFFYLDETAVMPSHQGRGVGRALLQGIFQERKRVLLRTLNNSSMCSLAKKFGGEIVQYIDRERVIMTITL